MFTGFLGLTVQDYLPRKGNNEAGSLTPRESQDTDWVGRKAHKPCKDTHLSERMFTTPASDGGSKSL